MPQAWLQDTQHQAQNETALLGSSERDRLDSSHACCWVKLQHGYTQYIFCVLDQNKAEAQKLMERQMPLVWLS